MFQPTPKRCFTIESLVAKDNPVPASRSEEPIRPAALSYANSGQMNPFLNGFHSGGRGVYSNPDLVFAEAVAHPPNSAVPVHPVAPPHALAAHPLSSSHSPHPLFASQQRDPSTFYPWLLHRYRYLGHRFQGKFLAFFFFLFCVFFFLVHFYAAGCGEQKPEGGSQIWKLLKPRPQANLPFPCASLFERLIRLVCEFLKQIQIKKKIELRTDIIVALVWEPCAAGES